MEYIFSDLNSSCFFHGLSWFNALEMHMCINTYVYMYDNYVKKCYV